MHATLPIQLAIALVGDAGAGKTSLMQRYFNNTYDGKYKATLGADFEFKLIQWQGREIRLQVWDIGGCERARSVTQNYYRNTVGAIVLYDRAASKPQEAAKGICEWKEDVVTKAPQYSDKMPILLLANKCDLEATVKDLDGQAESDFAAKNGFIGFMEVSAKTGANVDAAFLRLVEEAMKIWQLQHPTAIPAPATVRLQTTQAPSFTPGGCEC